MTTSRTPPTKGPTEARFKIDRSLSPSLAGLRAAMQIKTPSTASRRMTPWIGSPASNGPLSLEALKMIGLAIAIQALTSQSSTLSLAASRRAKVSFSCSG